MPNQSIASRVRVVLAEDQFLAREGLARLLAERPELELVATAADFDGVLEAVHRTRPDAVVMDIKMPPSDKMEGIEAAHRIRAELPGTGVVVLTQHDEEAYVWELLKHGVEGLGYLHKVRVGDVDQLVRAIREVASGGSVLDSRIVERLLSHRARKPGSAIAALTPAERETLRLMAEGRTNVAIAQALSVSLGGIEKRIATILSKLGLAEERDLNRRVAAVLIYLRETGTPPVTSAPPPSD